MTAATLDKEKESAAIAGLTNVEFREGFGEQLPVLNNWADATISNGMLNLMPDKLKALIEMFRLLSQVKCFSRKVLLLAPSSATKMHLC